MAMYEKLEEAFEDFKRMKELTNREQFLKTFIWCLPGTDGRKNGKPSKKQNASLKYKSEGVIEGEKKYSKNGIPSKQIVDEHVVPRKLIKEKLLSLLDSNEYTDYEKFKEIALLAKNCLITKEENNILNSLGLKQKMPEGQENDIWARYKKANINVYEKQEDGSFTKLNF